MYIVSSCFNVTIAELTSHNRPFGPQAGNIYCLALYGKYLLTPDLKGSQRLGLNRPALSTQPIPSSSTKMLCEVLYLCKSLVLPKKLWGVHKMKATMRGPQRWSKDGYLGEDSGVEVRKRRFFKLCPLGDLGPEC